MYYDFYKTREVKYDDNLSGGVFVINPTLNSLQEVIMLYVKELAYYILKLKDFSTENQKAKENLIKVMSGVITNSNYTQEQFQHIITTMADYLTQAKNLYSKLCYEKKLECKFLRSAIKHSSQIKITAAIQRGEKYFLKKNSMYSPEQKDMLDILLILAKSMCIKIIQLKSYGKDYDFGYFAMLELLNEMNFYEISIETEKENIKKFMESYNLILKKISEAKEERFGRRDSVQVSFSVRKGKAILVSGIDLVELESILKATQGRDIDVYTHGIDMLMGHTYEKLRDYPNLRGHFGKSIDNCLIDFAAFPGAILTTKHYIQKLEYLFRGRLFTTDYIAPYGVIKIHDDNYEPLIKSALDAKGFSKDYPENSLRVGFYQQTMEEKVEEILSQFKSGKYKHLFIVGLLNFAQENKAYFEEFFKHVPDDSFVLSLAYDYSAENVLHVDSFFDYSFIYKVFDKINTIIPLGEMNITVYITKCDQHIIANLLNFKMKGIKDIYLCKCIPTIANPHLIQSLKTIFALKEFSNPVEDIKNSTGKD